MTQTDDVILAETARLSAIRAGDGPGLLALLDPRYQYIHANGRRDDRDSLVTRIASGRPRHHAPFLEVEGVTLLQDSAVTRGRIGFTIDLPQGELRLDNLFLAVWVRHGNGWRQLALQTTARPKPVEGSTR